jgi:predicted nucleic acid-binding protein
MKQRIYVDTSVLGGIFDDEFKEWSIRLLEEFRMGKSILVLSDITLQELEGGPDKIHEQLSKIPEGNIEKLKINNDAKSLAQEYLKEGVVTEKYLVDAQHIAIASVFKVDLVVSWNFKHIVNYKKIRLYNGVNLKNGYPLIEIRSPREVVDEKERI